MLTQEKLLVQAVHSNEYLHGYHQRFLFKALVNVTHMLAINSLDNRTHTHTLIHTHSDKLSHQMFFFTSWPNSTMVVRLSNLC